MPLSVDEKNGMLLPTRRMSGYDAVTRPWVPTQPATPPPSTGGDWPARAVDGAGDPYPVAIALRGPVVVSDFLKGGLKSVKLAAGLDRLERELKKGARANDSSRPKILPGDFNWNYANLDTALARPGATALTHHLLRDTLLATLTAKGFSLATPVVPLGLLSNDAFYDPMMYRKHMKDVLVGRDHGEWTHMLQWYLLATVSDLKAGYEAAEVFEYLGRQGVVQYAETGPRWGPNLWRVCCDRDAPYIHYDGSPAQDTNDLRNPDMLYLALAGYGPQRQIQLGDLLAGVGSAPLLATFTTTRDAWVTHRDRWPLLCTLLRRRVLKREPLYRRADTITEGLKEEVRARVRNFLALTDVVVATSNLDGFLKDVFSTPASGPIRYHTQHLTFPSWWTPSAAEATFLAEQMAIIRAEYDKFFLRANPDAIAYGWARRHRRNPGSIPPPPAPAQALDALRALPPATQDELLVFARSPFRAAGT